MAWRQDEIWLETDPMWFLEHVEVSPYAPLPAPPDFSAANGLAYSRWRRADVRRRRQARRTRAAALVIAPAAMLSLAGGRTGGTTQAAGALAEDPVSLTFRPGDRAAAGANPRTTRASPPAAADQLPEIRWRNATSHGLHYGGWLTDGTQLPLEGPDWVTWNPVTDIVPNDPHRLYGNERTIRRILAVVAAYRDASPKAPRVVIGDISFPGGGPMEAHVSHQNGLDVDVYYPRLDRRLRAPRTTAQVDRALAQDLLDRFVAAGAQMVFVGYATGLRGPKAIVIPYPNHEDHLHVRFPRG
jgi:murein endopeptidase